MLLGRVEIIAHRDSLPALEKRWGPETVEAKS